ncbi:MAG: glycoside hydrolase family 32 protein [Armatimonadota bacterium]|nr:MAG: glycoside hydrolase family 32 protein [Armatimonadota bacterium]
MEKVSNSAITEPMLALAQAVARAEADPARPIYHLAPPANWNNDPNGCLYCGGYYHVFYQHNPYGDEWDHMHWGHARSRDLVHWDHLPIALWPSKERGEQHCFSGSAIVSPKRQPMLFYTSIGERPPEQWAAVPGDNDLITWQKHPANPILTEKAHGDVTIYDWRDPFVVTDEGIYYMIAGGNLNQGKGGQAVVNLYVATDDELTQWEYVGVIFHHPDEDVTNIECPNLFRVGDKWVLVVSPHRAPEYFVGDFEPARGEFTWQSRGVISHGNFYAPQVMLDRRGRRLLWGWVTGFPTGRGWNGCLSLPRVLDVNEDGRLVQRPAPELAELRGRHTAIPGFELHGSRVLGEIHGDTLEMVARLELRDATAVGLRVRRSDDGERGVAIRWDGATLDVAGTQAPLRLTSGQPLELHVFLDRSVLEAFAGDGEPCMTRVISAADGDCGVEVFAEGGAAVVAALTTYDMQSIW